MKKEDIFCVIFIGVIFLVAIISDIVYIVSGKEILKPLFIFMFIWGIIETFEFIKYLIGRWLDESGKDKTE